MRRLTAILVLTMVAVVAFAGCATSYATQRSEILANAASDNLRAEGAPQQAVVSGWAIRDMTALVAEENIEQAYLLYGVVALLALLFLALVVVGARIGRTNRELAELRKIFASASTPPSQGPVGPPSLG